MTRRPERVAPACILVVEDDPKIVRLVRLYLERDGHEVVEALDGRAALARFRETAPALIVLDLMLPGLDGMAVLRAIRASSDTPVIILSARGTTDDRIEGLREGADDYLPKPFSPAELALRVSRVLARRGGAGPQPGEDERPLVLRDLELDPARHRVTIADREVELTNVEFRLLAALLRADGRVLSRDQLLDAVYGVDEDAVLDRTIDVHVGRLRDKLGDRAESPRYVATVRGVGYRMFRG